MEDKSACISQTFSATLDDNFSNSTLGEQEVKRSSSSALKCTGTTEHISLGTTVDNTSVAMVQGKDSVIMINPQVSGIVESQQTDPENVPIPANGKIDVVSDNSSCHQTDTFGDADQVSSNYYVLVEGSDGSQVISRVIPSILSSSSEEPQLAYNAVLQSDISYIDNSALSEGKDTSYASESVTMIIDPNLQVQESQKIFIDPSLGHVNSQGISTEQLAILEKNSGQNLGASLPQKSIVVDSSLLSPHYQSLEVSSQKEDNSSVPQIRIIDVSKWDTADKQTIERPLDLISVQSKEVEKQLKEEQRQIDLRLLEQSHREYQEKLLHRKVKEGNENPQISSDESEKILKEAGIDDDTPIFSYISAKINPDLLQHVPGCQNFLLTEASKTTDSSGVTFSSELNCYFSGNMTDFVSLHALIKKLLKLLSPSHLVFDKCTKKVKQENKSIGCDLLVPYVSSKGRLSKQSSKLMQMGGLFHIEQCLSDTETEDGKGYVKRKKRGCRKRKVLSIDMNTHEETLDFASNYGLNVPDNGTSDLKPEDVNCVGGSVLDEYTEALNPDVKDPLQRRLDEEMELDQLQQYDESRLQEHMETDIGVQGNIIQEIKDKDIVLPDSGSGNTRRSTKGRPPKKFDPSETVTRVKPRNPLTESLETKQRRVYEENVSFKFFCDQCSYKTKRRSQFDNHLAYHEKGTDVKHYCRHCDFISISLPALKQHELFHKKNVLRCTVCKVYVTDKKRLMQKHMRHKHSGKADTTTFSCNQCPASFTSRIALDKHTSQHLRSQIGQSAENTSSNVCTHCKKSFGKKIHLVRHLRDVHGPQLRPHLCDKCGRSFKRKDALQQHRITHIAKSARVLPFKCDKCDKAFRSQAHLKEHSTIHTSDRPFLCQYCGASFKTQPVQKKHILTLHLQPRTHVCAVCCRQFNTKNALQRHENTHKTKEVSIAPAPAANETLRHWQSASIDNDDAMKKGGVQDDDISGVSATARMMVSLEEDQTRTALVVETEGGAQVMVDPSLVPAMMASSETHSAAEGARTLEVSQSLIQTNQTDQAFYYLAGDQL